MIKRLFPIIIAACIFCGCSKDSSQESTDDAKTQEITDVAKILGTVKDADTGEPVQQVMASLDPTSKDAYTDVDGQFEFTDIEAQQYTVIVRKTGYQTNRKLVTVGAGETVNVILVMKKN